LRRELLSGQTPHMDLERLVPGIIGAFVGVIGWLVVGLYIQRRQFVRQARNAARAVYFELDVNRLSVEVARDYGSVTPLDRSSFERLLPELATLLTPAELRIVVHAYMAHAGYQQATGGGDEVPRGVRGKALSSILEAHDAALAMLRTRAFSVEEAGALIEAGGPEATLPAAADASPIVPERKGT
jgi:hypothetical protein